MLGYSDSNKRFRLLSSNWRSTKPRFSCYPRSLHCQYDVALLRIFHGRGGSVGSLAVGRAYSGDPGPAQRHHEQLASKITEQGELLAVEYSLPELALTTSENHDHRCAPEQPWLSTRPRTDTPSWNELMARRGASSRRARNYTQTCPSIKFR